MKKFLLLALILFATFSFAQSWQPIANLPSGRHHPVTFTLNGKGYAVTGTNSSNSPTKDFYEYDPLTDSWSTLTSFPGAARSFGIGLSLNGKGYLGFGATTTQYLYDLWSYDPQTGQWTQLAICPCTGRRHPAMIALGNKIYVGLGDDANGNLRDWWMYNINTDSWTQIGNLPGPPRHHPFQFKADGELFAGMGHGAGIYDDWYKLDTTTNSWTAVKDFPGEARVAGTQFSWNGFGFVLSGDGSDHSFMATGEMWRYAADTDSWTQFAAHPGISRWAPGSFVINDHVYFFGGFNRLNQQYPLAAYKFDLAGATVSIEEQTVAGLSIFPNPGSDVIHWDTDQNVSEVQVLNTVGQLIKSTSAHYKELNISSLQPGIYLVQFKEGEKVLRTVKWIKE